MEHNLADGPILLFDGICNLCNRTVQFILCFERDHDLRFSSLQSELGQQILRENQMEPSKINSLIYYNRGSISLYSDAVIASLSHMRAPWRWLKSCRYLPKSFRDRMYRFIARRRYVWFGKRKDCIVPASSWQHRMLT
ncbi:MAG: DCC1-like thiol-disulfide oxidoreductase family protein [Saprospiraceae bacterium]|nr:DCC1-like thiol-disulfide oxidoreductase family protein [Saprospiraceae bacterium]